jgi:hypothetical protein
MKYWICAVGVLLAGCRDKTTDRSLPRQDLFRESSGTGLTFTHSSGAAGKFLMTEIMGAGLAVLDYDNDGDTDVFFVQSVGPSLLFRNELIPGGSLRFSDVTARSGIDFDGYGMGAATGDYNNDGFTDLLVTGYDRRDLFRNKGDGTFARVDFPQSRGVWSTSASFFDYDRDGRLDVVILSYVNFRPAANKTCHAPTGEVDYCTPKAYAPASARLYRNEGGDRFTDVTLSAGLDRALGPGLGVAAADFNDDGFPDLFVANDTAQNHLWMNQRDGTFRERGLEAGSAYSEDGLAKAGMGVAVGDSDGDGKEDLFVVNLMREGATLYRRAGSSADGLPAFVDATRQSGLFQITLPYTGFGTAWIDYDNDGLLDLFIANGAVTLREEQRGQPAPFKEKNLLIRNSGGGKFTDVTGSAGGPLQLHEVTRGAATADIDNDGDLDILMTNNNGPARLLLNDAGKASWLQIRAVNAGKGPHDAIGSKITLHRDGLPPLVRHVHTDSSYCSAGDPRVHFGLGSNSRIRAVEITWPDAKQDRWEALQPNQLHVLTRRQ